MHLVSLYNAISEKSWAVWIVSSFPLDLSECCRIFLHPQLHSLSLSKHVFLPHLSLSFTSLSLTSLSPSIHVSLPLLMFLLSLFPPPLKCRNPSTAFYQAFRPSRLRGSKPVNDRYELGCVYMFVWTLAWLTKPDLALLQPHTACKKMSILTCRLAVYGVYQSNTFHQFLRTLICFGFFKQMAPFFNLDCLQLKLRCH